MTRMYPIASNDTGVCSEEITCVYHALNYESMDNQWTTLETAPTYSCTDCTTYYVVPVAMPVAVC